MRRSGEYLRSRTGVGGGGTLTGAGGVRSVPVAGWRWSRTGVGGGETLTGAGVVRSVPVAGWRWSRTGVGGGETLIQLSSKLFIP